MSKLEKALVVLKSIDESSFPESHPDSLGMTLATLLYLGFLLSIPLTNITPMIWMGVYLAIAAPWLGISYSSVFLKSLFIIPLVALIGIFNPLLERNIAFSVYGIPVSYGWLSFIGIMIRGILSIQMVMVLFRVCGIRGFCQAMRRLHVPSFLINQMLMVFRYLRVLLEEALTMRRSRESRGYGKKSYSLRMWGEFVGQLFLRSVARAERIHRAMLARGYSGDIPFGFFSKTEWKKRDTIFLLTSAIVFILIRIYFR